VKHQLVNHDRGKQKCGRAKKSNYDNFQMCAAICSGHQAVHGTSPCNKSIVFILTIARLETPKE
ncbi:MAG: hypothetical protein WA781_04030, partial [Pseudolabrys sp.]